MATIHFPDVAHYQSGLKLDGAVACMAKATQGTSYVDPTFQGFHAQAVRLKIPFVAYHWLDTSDAIAQARHCWSVVGGRIPLMIDDEQHTIAVWHTLSFVTEFRRLGGRVVLEYAPKWVWENSGRPDLRPLTRAGLHIVSSNYHPYTDTGPGWAAYGGVTPTVWQYADNQLFNGKKVDFNAYRGTVDEFHVLLGAPANTGGTDMALKDELLPDGKTNAAVALQAVYDALPMLRNDDVRLNFLANTSGLVPGMKDLLGRVSADPGNSVHIPAEDRAALAHEILTEIAAQLGQTPPPQA